MYFMREKIEQIIHNYMDFYNIKYGYDCIGITIINATIPLDIIESIKQDLNCELVWFRVVNGNLMISYDISNFILNWFGSWDKYDKEYKEELL